MFVHVTNFTNLLIMDVMIQVPYFLFQLQRKRHIGNDMVCIVFLEAVHTKFTPDCIKSNFLHTFIIIQVDPSGPSNKYTVSDMNSNTPWCILRISHNNFCNISQTRARNMRSMPCPTGMPWMLIKPHAYFGILPYEKFWTLVRFRGQDTRFWCHSGC